MLFIRMDYRMMSNVSVQLYTMNIYLHIYIGISWLLNLLRPQVIEKAYKELTKKNSCTKKAIFNSPTPELFVC